MILVTGGAGFIGSQLIKGLNAKGHDDIVVVDNLARGEKFNNLTRCRIWDYWDKDDFIAELRCNRKLDVCPEIVFHCGACTVTTTWDGRYMMRNNYHYSKELLEYCLEQGVRMIYASSAAVYGHSQAFSESQTALIPLNIYGYSKLLLDAYVRRRLPTIPTQVVGLRFFNVYGPGEGHKGPMASLVYHLDRQLREHGAVRIFSASHGFGDGQQRRDFVYIDDVVTVCLWFLEHGQYSGIFNLGSGRGRSFNELARAVIAWHGKGAIEYIPFPKELINHYQAFTEADLGALRALGYDRPFLALEEGVRKYLDWLNACGGSIPSSSIS
ncbi:MAG: ADP-glyceromanno-heptose 6-epimerase [Gammaproteobacteria bacterium]